jgi:prephenate dehydrogenase
LVPSPSEPPFGRVAVLGLGVMGGSLARALQELAGATDVVAWSPDPAERVDAVEAGAVDKAPGTWQEAVLGVDLVVLAAPLAACCDLLPAVAAATPEAVTLTDVASLKVPLERAAGAAGVTHRWVGCHPMAGSERSGFAASRAGLYRDARVWVAASPEAAGRVERVHDLWRAVGARPQEIDAERHDALMARASHLPQLASNASGRSPRSPRGSRACSTRETSTASSRSCGRRGPGGSRERARAG